MKVLSIETSCDETGISVLESKGGVDKAVFKVLANNIASQIEIHKPYGGVYPTLAKREHIKNLPILLEKTLREAKLYKKTGVANPGIDLIAVTYGPGLEPALWTGITFAKELSAKWKAPLIPVNHMEGHVLSVFGKSKGRFEVLKNQTPALSLLVSGGHTEIVLSKKWMEYKVIGATLDDAAGEAFDKVARMLGLPYPGGPEISRLAEEERKNGGSSEEKIVLPRPMLHSKNFDFSFSGLKTAVLYLIRDIGPLDENMKRKIALEFENAAIECLAHKTKKAIEKHKAKTLSIGGGVAANKHLRHEIKKLVAKLNRGSKNKIRLFFPTRELSTDNSIMIGIVGYLQYVKNGKKVPSPGRIKALGNLEI